MKPPSSGAPKRPSPVQPRGGHALAVVAVTRARARPPARGRLPVNHQIIYKLQDIFNLLPNLNVEQLVKAFAVKTNDMMLAIYLSSIIRAVIALHNLVNNKLVNKEKERAAAEPGKKPDGAKAEEGKEGKDGEAKGKDAKK